MAQSITPPPYKKKSSRHYSIHVHVPSTGIQLFCRHHQKQKPKKTTQNNKNPPKKNKKKKNKKPPNN